MTTKYIGSNQYRYRYFKTIMGTTKFLLDVFMHPNFVNMSETTIQGVCTEEEIHKFALCEIQRIEAMN